MRKKFGEDWKCSSRNMFADRHIKTETITDMLIIILHYLGGGTSNNWNRCDWPIHDHCIKSRLSVLVRTASEPNTWSTRLLFTARAASNHCIHGCSTTIENMPRYLVNTDTGGITPCYLVNTDMQVYYTQVYYTMLPRQHRHAGVLDTHNWQMFTFTVHRVLIFKHTIKIRL